MKFMLCNVRNFKKVLLRIRLHDWLDMGCHCLTTASLLLQLFLNIQNSSSYNLKNVPIDQKAMHHLNLYFGPSFTKFIFKIRLGHGSAKRLQLLIVISKLPYHTIPTILEYSKLLYSDGFRLGNKTPRIRHQCRITTVLSCY